MIVNFCWHCWVGVRSRENSKDEHMHLSYHIRCSARIIYFIYYKIYMMMIYDIYDIYDILYMIYII